MFAIVIALIVLVVAVAAIYLLLKNMGEEGIEVAAPGSCRSGRCGVRCATQTLERDVQEESSREESDALKRTEGA